MRTSILAIDKRLTHYLIFGMLNFYLLIDMINGFFVLGLGIDIKLSVLYKAIILLLMLVSWTSRSPKYLLYFLTFVLLFTWSEVFYMMSGQSSGSQFGFAAQHVIKLITPFIAFFFLYRLVQEDAAYLDKIKSVIHINIAVFLLNMLLGVAGLGFSTYQSGYEDGIGIKGFFYAGNETSMVWIVLSAYILNRLYVYGYRLGYMVAAILVLFIGVMISTKTSILATMVLIVFTPVFIEKGNLFNPRKAIFYFFIGFICLVSFAIYQMVEQVLDSAFTDRIRFFYNKRGLLGIVLSGRELFFSDLFAIMMQEDSFFRVLFGMGVSIYADADISLFTVNVKVDSELDIPDIFFWHGMLGVCVIMYLFFRMIAPSLSTFWSKEHSHSSSIFMTNIMLFVIANVAGHVFTSGMLGFLWAGYNVLALHRDNLGERKASA